MKESQDRDRETKSGDRELGGGGGTQAGAQLVLGGGGGVSYQSSKWMKRRIHEFFPIAMNSCPEICIPYVIKIF